MRRRTLPPAHPLTGAQTVAAVRGDAVEPRAAVDHVARAVACGDRVVSRPAPGAVAAAAREQLVVAGVAVELVALRAAEQPVDAAAAEQPVAPVAAPQLVVAAIA